MLCTHLFPHTEIFKEIKSLVILLANRIKLKQKQFTTPHSPSLHCHPSKNTLKSHSTDNSVKTPLELHVICFLPSKHSPNQNIPAGTAWESTLKMEILLVNNVTRSMRPKNMQSSDLKTIIAKAENQMNGLCFCCIQNVNARSTAKKNPTKQTKKPQNTSSNTLNYLFSKG